MSAVLYINLSFENYKNKAVGQLQAFYELGYAPYLITITSFEGGRIEVYKYNGLNIELVSTKAVQLKGIKQQILILKNEIFKLNESKAFKIIYVRRLGSRNILFNSTFKKLSKTSKIVYEIPTYPLDKGVKISRLLSGKIEMLYFNLILKKYVSVIPVMLQKKVNLDPKMISINNGVDIKRFNEIGNSARPFNETIKMVSIAHLNRWHGLDRLVKSIYDYKGENNFQLFIVSGDSPELEKIKKMVKELRLDEQIRFLGFKELNELSDLVNSCHIGVGSLGYHRRGAEYDTSIKNKEYCAMALPFIVSSYDYTFGKDFNYMFKVASDDTLIDLDMIYEWYKRIQQTSYIQEMKQFSKDNLHYRKQMELTLSRIIR